MLAYPNKEDRTILLGEETLSVLRGFIDNNFRAINLGAIIQCTRGTIEENKKITYTDHVQNILIEGRQNKRNKTDTEQRMKILLKYGEQNY